MFSFVKVQINRAVLKRISEVPFGISNTDSLITVNASNFGRFLQSFVSSLDELCSIQNRMSKSRDFLPIFLFIFLSGRF
jgi:hypothetical protein